MLISGTWLIAFSDVNQNKGVAGTAPFTSVVDIIQWLELLYDSLKILTDVNVNHVNLALFSQVCFLVSTD